MTCFLVKTRDGSKNPCVASEFERAAVHFQETAVHFQETFPLLFLFHFLSLSRLPFGLSCPALIRLSSIINFIKSCICLFINYWAENGVSYVRVYVCVCTREGMTRSIRAIPQRVYAELEKKTSPVSTAAHLSLFFFSLQPCPPLTHSFLSYSIATLISYLWLTGASLPLSSVQKQGGLPIFISYLM